MALIPNTFPGASLTITQPKEAFAAWEDSQRPRLLPTDPHYYPWAISKQAFFDEVLSSMSDNVDVDAEDARELAGACPIRF